MGASTSAAVGTTLDYGIIIGYFVLVLGFGSFFGRHTRSTKDFFFGGQRFSWWIISFSLVATTVGSYSFIKYSRVAFTHGLSSTMSYTNDWFWMPMLTFVWIPIVYYSRVTSVPEYFERRFNKRVRLVTTVVIMVYLLGYIGINLLTMGVALKAMLGWDIYYAAAIVAVICGIYVTAGGQTSVIMTDLLQGFMLIIAGFILFGLGTSRLGGVGRFWSLLPKDHRLPLNYFNNQAKFNFVGVLWQDAVSQSMFAYFINQGMIMRFLSAKSPREGRKACLFLMLVLMFFAAVAVSNAGWLGRAMVNAGLLPADTDPQQVFVKVAAAVCQPGVFGFVMAALTAALMSTADTLLNATAAISVNDIYRPYFRPTAPDKHYLNVARIVSILAALVGLAVVPLFASFDSIYAAHGAFTAVMTPPMAAAAMLGAFWRRFNSPGALATIIGGAICLGISLVQPEVIRPFSFGVPKGGDYAHAWVFQRALFGLVCSMGFGVIVTLLTKAPDQARIAGLVWGTIDHARRRFKGSEPKRDTSPTIKLTVEAAPQTPEAEREQPAAPDASGFQAPTFGHVALSQDARRQLDAEEGDIVQIAHSNPIYGGLRSVQARVGKVGRGAVAAGSVRVPADLLEAAGLVGMTTVRVERVM
jgi:SSS family solute:Na+ symporter